MRILSLKLKNIGQHAQLEWDLQPGLIGIFGPNGSGKSSAINAGAYAALTNDFGRVVGGKEGAIRQQAESHEPAMISLKAEHSGTEFEVTRTLQPGSKHRLTSAALPSPLTKAGEIKAWLEGFLGLDRSIIDDYLFVGQKDFTAPFDASATARAKSWSQLCRTTHAEKCWEALGKQIETDRPMAGQVIDTSDGIRKRVGEYKTKLKEAKRNLKNAKAGVLPAAKRKAAKRLLEQREEHDWLSAELERVSDREATRLLETREAFAVVKQQAALCERAGEDLTKKARLAQVAEQKIKSYERDRKDWRRRVHCEEQFEELQGKDFPLPEKPQSADAVEQNREAWAEAKAAVAMCERWIAAIASGEGVCDSCGAPLDSEATKSRLLGCERDLPVHRQSVHDLHELIKDGQNYWHHLRNAQSEQASHERLVEQAQEALDACGDVEEPEAIDEDRQKELIDDATVARVLLHGKDRRPGLLAELRESEAKRSELKGQHQAAKTRVMELQKKLGQSEVTDEQVEEMQCVLKEDTQARETAQVAEALAETHQTSLNEQQEELERVQVLLSRSTKAGDWIKLQERMREVLHRDRLPRRVHKRAIRRMESGVNEILEQFDSPFWVTTDEELRFVAHFPSGTIMTGEGLSGGEQSVLALAFRWTLNSLFASQVGMLVLDEPTAWIDARNLDCLETALTNLRGLVQAQGYQVIIITHHQQLQRVFDQVITLE